MSRNSKNARLHAEAREMSKTRKSGSKGPAKTAAKHGKVHVRWKTPDAAKARKAVLLGQDPKDFFGKNKVGSAAADE